MLEGGKRLLLVSGTDYGEAMAPLIFSRGQTLCGWNEPPLAAVEGVPGCQVEGAEGQVRPLLHRLRCSAARRPGAPLLRSACLPDDPPAAPCLHSAACRQPASSSLLSRARRRGRSSTAR